MRSEEEILRELNPQQLEAVTTTEGPVLVLAGAGSGKTRVICHRLAYLIIHCGCPPEAIFTVTFTNKAAGEMKERVQRLTGLDMRRLWVSTFHSAAARMLRRDAQRLGIRRDFTIYDESDSEALVKEILKEMGLDPRDEKPSLYHDLISRAKDELLSPDAWIERTQIARSAAEKIHQVYSEYQRRMKMAGALDFGDLLVYANRLIELPEVLKRYNRMFRYVMVDEYQDTNHAQYRMARLLSKARRNICAVGDDDQAIYEWRGADRRNIISFETDYPDAKVFTLTENYRSTQPILDAASALIGYNQRLREKKLFTSRLGGAAPSIIEASTEYDEVDRIVTTIRKNMRAGDLASDHAVFYRVHSQTRVIEELFSAAGIPYQILRGVSFYQRAEIKDMVAWLKVLVNPDDDVSLRRIINKPTRGVGDATVAKLAAIENDKSLFASIDGVAKSGIFSSSTARKLTDFRKLVNDLRAFAADHLVADVVRELLERTKYLDSFDENDPEDVARMENVLEFLSAAHDFQESSEESTLVAFLERISLATDVDTMDTDADAVILSTLHSAKGLEFKHVMIVGCEESIFPHRRVLDSSTHDALEEERRLAYVGFTRAKDTLALSFACERRLYGKIVRNPPSRFLRECGLLKTRPSRLATPWYAETGVVAHPVISPALDNAKHADERIGILEEGDRVMHHKFGEGEVIYVVEPGEQNEVVQVRFRSGVKNLMSRYTNLVRF